MTLEYHARYFVEHKGLPHAFYTEGCRLLSLLLAKEGQALRDYYTKLEGANPDYLCPYDADDFEVNYRTYIQDRDSCLVVRVEMPEPEDVRLCRAVFFVYGDHGSVELYFTSEFTEEGTYFLCAWDEEGAHFNFGDAPCDDSDEMDKVASLFWEMRTNGGIERIKGLCRGEG